MTDQKLESLELGNQEAKSVSTKSNIRRDIIIAVASAIIGAIVAAIISPYYASKHTEKMAMNEIEILGNWDDKKARSIVLEKLNIYDWSQHKDTCIRNDCEPPHTLFKNTYNFPDNGSDWKVIIAETNGGGGAHYEQPFLSIFEFQHTNRGWDLATQDIALTQAGSWGDIDESMFNEGQSSFGWITRNKRALFLGEDYTNHGITYSGISVFAKIGKTYESLLQLETGCDDFGMNGEKGTSLDIAYDFLPSKAGFFDLAIKAVGTVNKEPFNYERIYHFNGHSYFPEANENLSYLESGTPPDCGSIDKNFGAFRASK